MTAIRGNDDYNIPVMSLGDHLAELQYRLIRILIGVGIGLAICLIFGSHIIGFIQRPYIKAISTLHSSLVEQEQGVPHSGEKIPAEFQLQTLAPGDGIMSYMRISLLSGLILSSPWVFYQIWMFIGAGLYPRERTFVYRAAPASAILFIFGALFFIFVVAPLSLTFLVNFNDKVLGLKSAFTFTEYISFITTLTIVFGIAFQMPIGIFFLTGSGLLSIAQLCKARKYVLFAIVIIAAIATPPDIISQLTLALPLYLLYELGIIFSRIGHKRSICV